MKKILLLLLSFSLLACTKEDEDSEFRSFNVEAAVQYEGIDYPVNQEFTVYYFEGIDVSYGYEARPEGILINHETGESITYSRKIIGNNGIAYFDNIPKDMHSVIVDMSNTFKQEIDIVKISAHAVNLGTEYNGFNGIKLSFNISPYSPSTVYQ